MPRTTLLRIAVIGCLAVALAGCGSSPSKTAPSAAVKPANLAALSAMVIKASDLPAGWKGTAYKADPTDAATQATLLKCVGARNTDGDKVAEAHSQDFALDNASVSSSATSYRSQADLDSDMATLHSPKLSTCYHQLITTQLAKSLPGGARITSASIAITPGSAGGPDNVLATGKGTINVTVAGQHLPIYVTVAFIVGPLIEAEVDTENIGSPVPVQIVSSLVNTVANRAAKG